MNKAVLELLEKAILEELKKQEVIDGIQGIDVRSMPYFSLGEGVYVYPNHNGRLQVVISYLATMDTETTKKVNDKIASEVLKSLNGDGKQK